MPRNRIATTGPLTITVRGPRSADTAELQEQFPGTPHLNEYDVNAAMAIYQECLDGVQTDNVDFEMGVNMDYGDAPAIPADVDTSDPSMANAFVPNPCSPGTHNPKDFVLTAETTAYMDSKKIEQWPIGYGGVSSDLDPATSSATISGRSIEDIVGAGGPTEV